MEDPRLTSKEYFDLGLEALQEVEFETAKEHFEKAVLEDFENVPAWVHLGLCHLETQRPDLAIESLQRALLHDSRNAMAHYLMGNARGNLGELDKAADCYRRALEIDPQHFKSQEFLNKTLTLLDSRSHYLQTVKLLNPAHRPSNWLNAAIRELILSLAAFPQSPARFELARCIQEISNYTRERLVEVDINDETRHWAECCDAALQNLKWKNWSAASASYKEALHYRDEDAFVHHALGVALYQLEQLDSAVQSWLRVLDLEPGYDFYEFGKLSLPKSVLRLH